MLVSNNHIDLPDLFVIGSTLLISLGIGVYYGLKSQNTTNDLLLGNREMNVVSVAASFMVSFLSGVTILGFPAEIYYYGSQIVMLSVCGAIGTIGASYIFVPVMYNLKLTSSFQGMIFGPKKYFELRFESILLRRLMAILFITVQVLMNGVILYSPAIAVETMVGTPIWVTITCLGLCCTVYSSVGGFKAVVLTDCFQLLMIVVGLLAIVLHGFSTGGGVVHVLETAAKDDRLTIFDFSVDPFKRHNFFNFLFGIGFIMFCMSGVNPIKVQRYSSLPNLKKAIKMMLITVPFTVVTTALTLLTGLAVYATYVNCDPLKAGLIRKRDEILPFYVLEQLAYIPGMRGLFISCMLSAVLSTISSIINTSTAVAWSDIFSRMKYFEKLDDGKQAYFSRFLTVIFGLLAIGMAFLATKLGNIIAATISILSTFYGPIGTVTLLGIMVPFMNKHGAFSGLLFGLVASITFTAVSTHYGKSHIPMETNVHGCGNGTVYQMSLSVSPLLTENQLDWPEKIFTISYLLNPMIGSVITSVVGIIVSTFTGGYQKRKYVNQKCLHRLVRSNSFVKPTRTDIPRGEPDVVLLELLSSDHEKQMRNC